MLVIALGVVIMIGSILLSFSEAKDRIEHKKEMFLVKPGSSENKKMLKVGKKKVRVFKEIFTHVFYIVCFLGFFEILGAIWLTLDHSIVATGSCKASAYSFYRKKTIFAVEGYLTINGVKCSGKDYMADANTTTTYVDVKYSEPETARLVRVELRGRGLFTVSGFLNLYTKHVFKPATKIIHTGGCSPAKTDMVKEMCAELSYNEDAGFVIESDGSLRKVNYGDSSEATKNGRYYMKEDISYWDRNNKKVHLRPRAVSIKVSTAL